MYLTSVAHTQQYGLIGYPLSHSFSPGYFNARFEKEGINAQYNLYPIENIQDLPAMLRNHTLHGLNVTIPHKQTIIPYLDALDHTAAAIGAVNCVRIRNGHTKGYNTDVTGFSNSLQPLLQPHHTSALILGTGGSSHAVAYALQQLGISYRKISRSKGKDTIAYSHVTEEMIKETPLIINCTPIGMHPNENAQPPLPYHAATPAHLFYDLIYNPAETKFLYHGREQGAATKNGLEMLHLQAEASWHIWNS